MPQVWPSLFDQNEFLQEHKASLDTEARGRILPDVESSVVEQALALAVRKKKLDLTFNQRTLLESSLFYRQLVIEGSEYLLPLLIQAPEASQSLLTSF